MKKGMKFEEALKELTEINDQLENTELSLEESMKLFKEGLELTKFCQNKLEEARQKITEIEG